MHNIRLHGMPTTSFEKVLLWKVIRYSYQLFYFLFYIISEDIIFTTFLEFHSTLSEKNFRTKFSFFDGFTPFPQPHHLNGQNLLNVTKVFCRFSLRCLLKYSFSLKFIDKILQSIFQRFQLQILWSSFQNIVQQQLFWDKHKQLLVNRIFRYSLILVLHI